LPDQCQYREAVTPLDQMFGAVLLCPPEHFEVKDVKNPHMDLSCPVDAFLALQQWDNLRRKFQELGMGVQIIDPIPELEDLVFTNNQVFVGFNSSGDGFVIPSRMRYESRQREVPHVVQWFRERQYQIIDLSFDVGGFLEGHGDLLWHCDMKRVWAGYGIRSTYSGIARFSETIRPMGVAIIPLQLTDPHFYHLDTCLAPLNAEAVLIYREAFSLASYASIKASVPRVHEIGRDEALGFMCNGTAIRGHYLASRLTPRLEDILGEEGLEPLPVECTEFEKSGGSVCCLKLLID